MRTIRPISSGTPHGSTRPRVLAQYAPAYRYGYTLATEPRYAGRDWSTIEAEARRDWEARHQGTWDEFKDAVFYGWEHVRGQRHADAGDVRIPIVEEAIHVETRQVERGGVRIYSHVTEQPVEQEVRLRDERVTVEHRPVDRPATEHDLAAFKEGTIEVSETHEEAIVDKQARVVEEVVINKEVQERTETVRDTVRRTEVNVEPIGKGSTPHAHDYASYEPEFRSHYDTAFASRGSAYNRWAPAYRYGYDLAADPHYRDRAWATAETMHGVSGSSATKGPGKSSRTPSATPGTRSAGGVSRVTGEILNDQYGLPECLRGADP